MICHGAVEMTVSEPKEPIGQSASPPQSSPDEAHSDESDNDGYDLSEEETGEQPVRPTPLSTRQSFESFDPLDEAFTDPFMEEYSEDYTSEILPDEHTEQFEIERVFVPPPLAKRVSDSKPANEPEARETPWQSLHDDPL